jgi:FecR protein
MKNLIFLLLVAVSNLFAQRSNFIGFGTNDSLLYDGAGVNTFKPDKPCSLNVKGVKGKVIGTVIKWEIIDICGEKDSIETYEKRQLKPGDQLKPGEDIETGPDGEAYIKMPKWENDINHFNFWVGADSKINIPKSACDLFNMNTKLLIIDCGLIHFMTHTFVEGKKSYEISLPNMSIGWGGTEFTVIHKDGESTVKVYEGTVKAELKKYDESDLVNANEEMRKLGEDFQNGKITIEEFNEKSAKHINTIKNEVSKLKMSENIEAGYQCTIGEKIGDKVPLVKDDDLWWTDLDK